MGEQIVIDPDDVTSVDDEPLFPIELRALEHWERFQPSLVRQLRQQSEKALHQAIRNAYHRMEYGIALTQARNPALHRLQIEELFRDELFPPPEPLETPDQFRPTTDSPPTASVPLSRVDRSRGSETT